MNTYDIVIIGGGISGLYAGYNILKKSPNKSIAILEKSSKQWIGGRAGNDNFYGSQVSTGAGIGRKDTNPLLIKLLKELGINFYEFNVSIEYASTIQEQLDVVKVLGQLKKEFVANKSKSKSLTFKKFASQFLGSSTYKNFIISSGYSDYEKADVYETSGWIGLSIPWKKLVIALCDKIGWSNIKCSTNVIKIQEIDNFYKIYTESDKIYYAKQVVIATTINQMRRLIPGANGKSSPYQEICSQPFLRVYAKFDKESTEIIKQIVPTYTVVPGPLQKIIPINPAQGIYMIAYSDNDKALALEKYIENTDRNRRIFQKLIKTSLGIDENLKLIGIKGYFWSEGTHYYKPLDTKSNFKTRKTFLTHIQNPHKQMYVIGEAVSRYQGWVEGGLQSVETILHKLK